MKEKQSGITLIALVITIVILLILAGISIATLGGENGLLAKANEAKKAQIEAEMKEKLQLAIHELQIEKLGEATLDDITQEWLNEKLKDYQTTIQDDPTTGGKKVTIKHNGITGIFIIDKDLNVIKKENNEGSLKFTYEVGQRDGEKVKITIKVQDAEKGIEKIDIQDRDTIIPDETNGEISIEQEVQIGEECKITITLANGEKKEETILINKYYHKIEKNLEEGISIDNEAVKAAYNESYKAKIKVEGAYAIEQLTVTMGGQSVEVDKTTGIIDIDKVTGDIKITVTTRSVEIQSTTPIINTTETATNSVNDNSQTKGTPLYINFSATIEGNACIIEPTVPYAITSNGKYTFKATGTYNGKTLTKEINVVVNKYQSATGVVQYDAGEWTKEEIDVLKSKSLYNINKGKEASSALNFTFGGFTYKGDTTNESYINDGTVIISRNQSVTPQSGRGTPNYDGWQVLESKEKDGKTYVTKLAHAGSPENFVFKNTTSNDGYRAEYILSSGTRQTTYNTYQARNWDMYKDKNLEQKGYIKDIHAITEDEMIAIDGGNNATTSIRRTNAYYWLGSSFNSNHLDYAMSNGYFRNNYGSGCYGIRPVIELNDGVYIASGSGTEADPYILGKE